MMPRETFRRTDRTEWHRERNTQWQAGGWTISYLWRYDYLAEVWIWRTRSCSNGWGKRESHPLTPDPVGVRDAIDAYELVSRALRIQQEVHA